MPCWREIPKSSFGQWVVRKSIKKLGWAEAPGREGGKWGKGWESSHAARMWLGSVLNMPFEVGVTPMDGKSGKILDVYVFKLYKHLLKSEWCI